MQYDLTKPNSGRMFDYWLGGNHNFEIDRQFADQVNRHFPLAKEQTRLERAKIKKFVPFFYQHGIRAIIDFGSSLPTCDNTHLVAHAIDPSIKVVYCDIDPITVAYGQELLEGESNVIYLRGDAAQPLSILNAPETRALLGDERRLGINFLNLAHLLNDDALMGAWHALYDWVAPGSFMAVTMPSEVFVREPYLRQLVESYQRSGIMSYYRTREEFAKLVSPWQVTSDGILESGHYTFPDESNKTVVITYEMMLFKP